MQDDKRGNYHKSEVEFVDGVAIRVPRKRNAKAAGGDHERNDSSEVGEFLTGYGKQRVPLEM